ncbi:MAG TPA: hypothetical protein VFE47_10630 [Tepidisphaeraceae bacterium]|nr:hypothetical protein [Tepidisphaeraceae bacterium]
MSKVSSLAVVAALLFSWLTISCTGPVFIKPPAAAAQTASAAVAPAAPANTLAVSTAWVGPGLLFSAITLVAIGLSLSVFRARIPD